MEWFDFDRIYNQTSSGSGLACVDERVSSESQPCNVAREVYVPVAREGAPSPVREMSTMTHVDDFPFVMEKLFSHAEVTETPVVSRAEEEAYMVRAKSVEDGCVHAHNCECMRMFSGEERFVMKRLVVAGERSDLCVLCTRMEVLRLYLDARANGIIPKRPLQPYRNIVGVVGEYDPKDCIDCESVEFSGVSEPFIMYSRAHYRSVLYDGERRVVQDLTDFRRGAAHCTDAL